MNLDEMEKLARGILDDDTGRAGENEWSLARALLAVMPVVRAAEALRDAWDGPCALKAGVAYHEEVELSRSFIAAIDQLRRSE